MSTNRDTDASIDSDHDVDHSVSDTRFSRRRLISAGIVAAAVPLAGCTAGETDSSDEPTDESDTQNETDVDDEASPEEMTEPDADVDDAEAVVRQYLLAAVEEDIDRMSELAHSQNPLDPAMWVDDGWEFRGGGDEEELDNLETAVIDDDATVDDVFELEGATFWFDNEELADDLDSERLVVIELTADDPTEDDMHWIIATEDDNWRYLFGAPVDSTPENPEELFEEPIEDENNDVVVSVDWDHDRAGDVPQAAVELTDERGVEANRIEIETTIEGAETGAFDRDDEDFTANWEGVTLFIPYNSEGDQLVVTAINEETDESEIVHREQFEP